MTIEPTAQIVAVSLDRIIRLSPLNPRQDMESDVTDLAAMIAARGQQSPIKLRPCPEDPHSYEVLDGGRRWRALRALAAAGDERDALATRVEGDEIEAREVALMLSVSPKPLHPVEEYESFARLEESGASVEQIATHFGQDARHVRQRLALGRLSPRVRGLWRLGEIDREQAIAFTAGPIEAQEALLDTLAGQPNYEWGAVGIRRKLRGETLSNSGPEGKFLLADKTRVEAYVAAGGRIEENLFEDEIVIRDPAIAHRIVNDALRAEAARVQSEEGWGAALIEGENDYDGDEPEPDFSVAEEARLEEINKETHGADPMRAREMHDEQEMIYRDALLRMIEREERAQYAIVADLDHYGRVRFTRGLPIPEPETEAGEGGDEIEGDSLPSDGEGGEPSEPGGVSAKAEAAIPDPLAEPGRALRGVIDAAVTQALRDVTRRRGDIALMLAVAALGCQYGAEVVKLNTRAFGAPEEPVDSLLAEIAGARFDAALKICAGAPTCDLSVALFRLIAAAIDTREARFETIGAICAAVRARGGDLKGAFDVALDRRDFFETAPKSVTLGCVTGLIGAGEAGRVKTMKKGALGDYVARLSNDKGHLPAPFADWAAARELPDAGVDAIHVGGETTLAAAMSAAIADDEAHPPAPAKKARAARKGKADAP
ncbi:ParB N-terminal domain-containing protein [Methylocystis sp. SC2]|uniref:ParB/RepB/Spo0J family partition protein n=1 Tax=Methylocystis sp. (strain SC2) TaxID=187303 RepID=UPI00027AEF40|nr:ParB N-terminal domain-containing protein [Methylocystis sp. SC2]CCJ07046.1 ParB domain protein nuclease [Methylocystis sp. SC2]